MQVGHSVEWIHSRLAVSCRTATFRVHFEIPENMEYTMEPWLKYSMYDIIII